jgi:hypothetical protein
MGRPTWAAESTNHAFFPLYPALMRGLVRATGIETTLAGNLISAAAFLGALAFLALFVERRWGAARVVPTVLALLSFPTAFFFAAVYTESLFLFLAAAAFVAVDRDRPFPAAITGFFAGLTRITGIVLAPYLFLVTFVKRRSEGRTFSQTLWRALLAGLAPVLGFAVFCGYFYWKFGDPLLFVRSQHSWAKEDKTTLMGPQLILRDMKRDIGSGKLFTKSPARTLEGAYLLLFAFLALGLLKDRRPVESLYVMMTIGIVLMTGSLESSGRYVLPAFPAFAVIGGLAARPAAFRLLLAVSFALQAAYVFAFVHWVWAG